MNLQPLFEKQAELDAHIEREHPKKSGEDRFFKKILALQVELGELANELPELFKFWSKKKNNREKALKEYVDGLHFILSIGLELEVDPILIQDFIEYEAIYRSNLIEHYNAVFYYAANVFSKYDKLFSAFVSLGEWLQFSWEEVEQAYDAKNAINHERQATGY